ncbi:MAG: M20/M25/M40 family metallo-hydrolase [Bacteriovorax sp.]|nr:M20/M25/M40 family metallo-hydrolase [Bacteriovorax sp.]
MKTLNGLILAIAMTATPVFHTYASETSKDVYISIDSDALKFSQNTFKSRVQEVSTQDGISILKIDEDALPWLSMLMHKNFNRCGGFMVHDDETEAMDLLHSQDGAQLFAKNNTFADYTINQEDLVKPMVEQVKEDNILATITKLSSFKNRYYKGEFGKQSAAYIKDIWTAIVKNRTDAKVEYFPHSQWDQPSIVLTLGGKSDDVIVLGGHQDSINGSFGGSSATAPGADDNASGISTITEVIRILTDNSYQPQKTIKFMAYAAEEVGLLGSKEISKSFKAANINVIGVMQLDMTNFQGTKDLDIVMMTDYTNVQQNNFVGSIIDKYVPGIKWGFDKCGYGCSDHASWNAQGYPASMPFEARMNDMNHNIHTAKDTLSVSGGNASHAAKFAKMALAYIVELDR